MKKKLIKDCFKYNGFLIRITENGDYLTAIGINADGTSACCFDKGMDLIVKKIMSKIDNRKEKI